MSAAELRISEQEMELFAGASGDRNPLHVSAEYARRTPFGEPVVYGVLAALAALAQLPEQPGLRAEWISLEFKSPLAVGVGYGVEVDGPRVIVTDLGQPALVAEIRLGPGDGRQLPEGEAVARPDPERADRETASGTWAPSLPHLRELLARWDLPVRGVDEATAAALAWTSYLVGMELPGERATFWKLDLSVGEAAGSFSAEIVRRDERVALVEIEATLGGTTASIAAFERAEPPRSDPAEINELLKDGPDLSGKVAAVIGGSRGLGAALTHGLAATGAQVVLAYRESVAEAERVRDSSRGTVELVRGDAADPLWCLEVLRPLLQARGGVDVLVCSASPPIRSLRLEPAALERFEDFVAESLGLVTAPLAALLPDLDRAGGTAVVVSSTALDTLPPEWPHYVAAKAAAEGVAAWAAAAHPRARILVVRPPKLLTDQMNSILGRVRAARVEPVAAEIVRRIGSARAGSAPELIVLD